MNPNRLDNGVAVVGMACRFPGAPDLGAYWRMLRRCGSGVQRFTAAELRETGVSLGMLDDPSFVPVCAPLDDAWAFDADHFGISPALARTLDLQHRVWLECAWTALEAAGLRGGHGNVVGVYAGCSERTSGLFGASAEDGQGFELMASLGSSSDYLAARVAYVLDLRGPCVSVRAACATSLLSVHLAVQALLTHDCDVAVAGGVAVRHPLRRGHLYEPGGIYSADGVCRPYDHRGTGIVSGDGAGAVVLRRLGDALENGDYIHAVICGTAVSNDGGRKASFTAPSVVGQVEAASAALELAGVDPTTLGFVEGHGTATPLGDPIEVEALRRAWSVDRPPVGGRCLLGSVKANIGHLDAAAGIAGLIKAVLAVEKAEVPGTPHFETPNPHLALHASPFEVSSQTRPWSEGVLRRASVNSLGLGGTNVHVVLEQAPPRTPVSPQPWVALPLSVRRGELLSAYGAALAEQLGEAEGPPGDYLSAVGRTLQLGRSPERQRRCVVVPDIAQATLALSRLGPPVEAGDAPPVIIAFPGDGRRLRGGLGELARLLPVVDETWRRGGAHMRGRWGRDLDAIVHGAGSPPGILPAVVVQNVAIHAGLAALGVPGVALLGQSLGELAASVAGELLGLEDALDIAMARETAFRTLPPSGAYFVGLSAEQAVTELPPGVELALVTAPARCVVSGCDEALASYAADLDARGVPVGRLDLISAVHCSLLDPAMSAFRAALSELRPMTGARVVFTTVGPGLLHAARAGNDAHWAQHLREIVRFDLCIKDVVARYPGAVVVDAGPAGGLTAAIREGVGGAVRDVVQVAPNPSDVSQSEAFLRAVGRLWEHGVDVHWAALRGPHAERVALSPPPLARTHHPLGALPVSARPTSGAVRLWVRGWQQARGGTAVAQAPAGRVCVLGSREPHHHALTAALGAVGADVLRAASVDALPDDCALVVDARGLSPAEGPEAAAATLRLAQTLLLRPRPPGLLVMTQGAFDVLGTEILSPSAAAVAMAVLVHAQEHGDLRIRCVDLPGGAPDVDALAGALIVEEAVWCALRGRRCWHPTVEEVGHYPPGGQGWAGRVCVLTGGLGRFGRSVGRWLAESGVRRIVLIGRSEPTDPRALKAIAAMQVAGAQVRLARVDVTDQVALSALLDEEAHGGPVTVFHLAGLPHAPSASASVARLVDGRLEDALSEQWAAKVGGAQHILAWNRRHPTATCVVFSSNAAMLGGPSLCAYAVANAAADAIARSAREREGLDWRSVAWDGWRLPDDDEPVPRTGLESVALMGAEPRMALWSASTVAHGQISVGKGDMVARHRDWVEGVRPRARVAPLAQPARAPLDPDEILTRVRELWTNVLGTHVGDDVDLFEQGGDSLSAMQLRSMIERNLGVMIGLPDILQNRTIARLTKRLRAEFDRPQFVEYPPDQERMVQGRI